MNKRKKLIFLIIFTRLIYLLDILRIIFFITWLRILIYNIFQYKKDNIEGEVFSRKKMIFRNIFRPRKYINRPLLQRELGIYEIDTVLFLKYFDLYKFNFIIEVGACYGYFSKKIINLINKKGNFNANTKLVSIEPSKSRFNKYLLPLKEKFNDQLIIINDFAGPLMSSKNKKIMGTFFDQVNYKNSFLFIDADLEGFLPVDLALSILSTFETTKFNLILIEMGNKKPYQDARKIHSSSLKKFNLLRLSKKRFIFFQDEFLKFL